jgi:AraC-like DNA-binding protein
MRTQAFTALESVPAKDCQVVRTTLGSWVKAIGRALEAAGCDSAALLAEAGFDLKSLDSPTVRCPLQFGAARTRLVFDCFAIERPLDGGNPELARHNDAIALQYLSQIERENIQGRVREVLTQRLAQGEPSQEDVAELLNMSARTLQRKLGDAGTTYKEILDETRRVLALAYLSAPRHTVGDVTYLLGFSAGSSFTRAFRRWTGQSPSDWRAGVTPGTTSVVSAGAPVPLMASRA